MSTTALEADPAAILARCTEITEQAKALMRHSRLKDRTPSTKALTTLHTLSRELEALRGQYRRLTARETS